MQNEVDNSGIKGIEEQDLGTVTVNPNEEKTVSAFPQYSDETKEARGLEDFRNLKKGFKKALPYIGQLGLDLVPGSGITEIFGMQPDIVEGGQRPSFAGQVERTTELAKEGKTTEAVVSGVDTALTGVAGVGEGIMVAGAMTGPLAPLLVGAGFAIKGLAKGGKLILQSTKTGKKILANYDGNVDVGFSIKNIEVPKDVESDPDIQTLEDTIDVPTTKTDDTDTEVAIPEIAKDLNTTEAITSYVVAPDKLSRNELIAKIEDDPEVKTKTDKYLDDQGYTEDTIPVYRIISVKDVTKGPFFNQKVLQKAEIGEEGIISGSLSPEANIKTINFMQGKGATKQEVVRYDVPRNKIKLTMKAYKDDIKQTSNKKIKEKGFGQEKIPGFQTVTNPSKTAKNLIEMQDEVIADVTGLKKNVLGSPKVLDAFDTDKLLKGGYKDYKQFKADLEPSRSYASMEDFDNMYNKKISIEQFKEIEDKKTKEAFDKVVNFYKLDTTKQDEGIKALEKKDITPSGFKFEPADTTSMPRKMYGRTYIAEDESIALMEIGIDGYTTKRLYGVNAMVDGKPRYIGKVTLGQSTIADDKKIDDLINIELDDDVRGKGFGEKIVKGLVNYSSRPEGLSIRDIKRNALPFWKKLGINFYEGSVNKGSRYKKYGFIPNKSGMKNVKYKYPDELKKEKQDTGIQTLGPQNIKEKGIAQVPKNNLEITPLKGIEIMNRTDTQPLIKTTGKVKVNDILEYLENPNKRDITNQKDFDEMVLEAEEEIANQLKQQETGVDWYDGDIAKTMSLLDEVNPKFKDNGDAKDLVAFMTAIFSSGTGVGQDIKTAVQLVDHYLNTGKIVSKNPFNKYGPKDEVVKKGLKKEGDPKSWTRQTNEKALLFADAFIQDQGLSKFLEYIQKPTTRREASKLAEKYGLKKLEGRKDDPIVGANLFGPKIGKFMKNLMGIEGDENVADIWFTRMMNRRQGKMFFVPQSGQFKGQRVPIEQPQSIPIREAYDKFIKTISEKQGKNNRDIQAILWYFEQRLYTKLGVPSEPKKYSQAIESLLEQRRNVSDGSLSQSNVAKGTSEKRSSTEKKEKPTQLKKAQGGFVERNTYDWVYRDG